MISSTLSHNSAAEFGGGAANNGQMTVTNSTFSANSAGYGGGIVNTDEGVLAISSSTFCANRSVDYGAGIDNSGRVDVKDSIVADSTSGADCDNTPQRGEFNSLGHNVDTDGTCPGFTRVPSEALDLGPLAFNGGPTQTHALLEGSIALDVGTDGLAVDGSPILSDQRGAARPQGAAADLGAQEEYVSEDLPSADIDVTRLLWRESFDVEGAWWVGPLDGGRSELREGEYWLTLTRRFGKVGVYDLPFIEDAYLEAEVSLDECPPGGYVAVSARASEQSGETLGYYFGVDCDFSYGTIAVSHGKGDWVKLSTRHLGAAEQDRSGSHLIGVRLMGNDLKLFVDGVEMLSAQDDSFARGRVGFYVESRLEIATLKVESLRVWALPPSVTDE